MIDETDLRHLKRCVALAAEAVEAGDEPFGSLLVTADGEVRREDHNRVTTEQDETRHPEFELARWAAANLTAEQRATATVYTSGEHCPMCSAAHAWVGLGRIVFASSTAQLTTWRAEWGLSSSAIRPLSINEIAPGIETDGPAEQFAQKLKELHQRAVQPPSTTIV